MKNVVTASVLGLMLMVIPGAVHAYDIKLPDEASGKAFNTKGKSMFTVVPATPEELPVVVGTGTGGKASSMSSSAPNVAAVAITKSLSRGLKNDPQVRYLQQFLVEKGYLTATPDGNFGPLTFAAVQKFQTANGISPLGIVGPQTRALIK